MLCLYFDSIGQPVVKKEVTVEQFQKLNIFLHCLLSHLSVKTDHKILSIKKVTLTIQ